MSLISIFSLALGVGVWIGNNPTPVVRLNPNFLVEPSGEPIKGWRSGVHLIHNGWFIYKDVPYGNLFAGAEVLLPALVGWLGAALFLSLIRKESVYSADVKEPEIGSSRDYDLNTLGWLLVGGVATAFLIGRDPIGWSFIASTLLILISIKLLLKRVSTKVGRSDPGLSTTTDITKNKVSSTNGLIKKLVTTRYLLFPSLLIVVALFFSKQWFPISFIFSVLTSPKDISKGTPSSFWLLIFFISIFIGITTPSLPILDYPTGAQLLNRHSTSNFVPPLIGPSLSISIIDSATLSDRLFLPILIIGFVSVIGIAVNRKNNLFRFVFFASLISGFDLIIAQTSMELSILQGLQRLIPYTSTFPVVWFLAGTLPLITSCAVIISGKNSLQTIWIIGVIGIVILSSQKLPTDARPSFGNLQKNLSKDLLFTPSRLIAENDEFNLNSFLRYKSGTLVHLSKFDAEINASSKKEIASQLTSMQGIVSPEKRWNPNFGTQTGSEWLAIRLKSSQEIVGIELDSGEFLVDYARGIRILKLSECDPTWIASPHDLSMSNIYQIDNWIGRFNYSKSGLPFYETPSKMTIYFHREETVQCLLIKQTGVANNDWSLTNINLIVKTP